MQHAFDRLHSLLMIIDPDLKAEAKRRERQRATTGSFEYAGSAIFSRVELVNFAAANMERLSAENAVEATKQREAKDPKADANIRHQISVHSGAKDAKLRECRRSNSEVNYVSGSKFGWRHPLKLIHLKTYSS